MPCAGGQGECLVDLFDACRLRQFGHQVDDRDGDDGHAVGDAVEFASQCGDDFAEGPGRACGGGNDVLSSRAGAARVFVTAVEDALVVGVGVDGGHHAAAQSEALVQHTRDEG